jgi:hypothetical protein
MHFILGTNFYIFRHQGSFLKEFIKNKGLAVQQVLQAPAVLTFITIIKGHIKLNF